MKLATAILTVLMASVMFGKPIRSSLGADNAKGGGEALPYDAEVEWIESVKPAYIDTGIKFLVSYSIALDMAFIEGSSNLDSGLGSTGDSICTLRVWSGVNQIQFNWYGGFNTLVSDSAELYSRHLYECNQRGILLDGIQKSSSPPNRDSPSSLKLAAYNDGNTERQGKCRYWGFQIFGSDGTPIIDFVPVRIGDEGFMYDRVSGKVFGNVMSTGGFLPGPDL